MHAVHNNGLNKAEKRKIWDEIINDYTNSGLSIRQYCEQHAIKYDNLAYHVYKKRKKIFAPQNQFIPVQIESSATLNQYCIRFNDIEIILPEMFKPAEVTSLIQAVRASIC
jgi:hypothetical protein